MRIAVAVTLLALLMDPLAAQVRGRCVSGCSIPQSSQRSNQQSQQNGLDPKLILTGVAAEIRGDVTLVYPNGQRAKANAQTPLAFGTRVITGPRGRAVFRLLDETTVTMGADGEMVMDEFVYDPDTSLKKMSIYVAKGVFRYITGKIARRDPANMVVRTQVATLGPRGTEFELVQSAGKAGYVRVNQGEVMVLYQRAPAPMPNPVPPYYVTEASGPLHGWTIVQPGETLHWDGTKAWRE